MNVKHVQRKSSKKVTSVAERAADLLLPVLLVEEAQHLRMVCLIVSKWACGRVRVWGLCGGCLLGSPGGRWCVYVCACVCVCVRFSVFFWGGSYSVGKILNFVQFIHLDRGNVNEFLCECVRMCANVCESV